MKHLFIYLFFCLCIINKIDYAQIRLLYNGELRIQIINSYSYLNFEATKVPNTSHWDFNNNLVLNNNYTFQQVIAQPPTSVVNFYWRDGEIYGMGKGIYSISVKNQNGVMLASFYYDLRTSKTYSGSPDLVASFNTSTNQFKIGNYVINNTTINVWDYVDILCCEPETDKFEPTQPINLYAYPRAGHPQLHWSNNEIQDYWTNVEVYKSEVNSGPPGVFQLIATLDRNSTSYYDTRYFTGSGAIAYYKVRKRNVYKNSTFSNTTSINIIPQNILDNNQGITATIEQEQSSNLLYQNFPNPFNPNTEIKFQIDNDTDLSLRVFDILGKQIITLVNGYFKKGVYNISFNSMQLSSGIYFYSLVTKSSSAIKKMTILK